MEQGDRRPDWIGVGIFFAVAAIWSWLAARHAVLSWPGEGPPPPFDSSIVAGLGPVAGGLAARLLRPAQDRGFGPLLGHNRTAALLALAAPTLTLAAFGLAKGGWNAHANGLIFAATVTVYCLGEELGWRGWLRRALDGLPDMQLIGLTALLWYAWHWTFLADQLIQWQFGLGFAVSIVLASWGLHAVSRRSGGSALAAAWHAASKAMGAPAQIAAMAALLVWASWRSGRGEGPRG